MRRNDLDIKKIHDGLSVASQITSEDVATLKDHGFKSIICNRPDDEEAGQPAFVGIEAAAKAAGLPIIYQPVVPALMDHNDAQAFKEALAELEAPVLAYCRTGSRCGMLWQLSQTL